MSEALERDIKTLESRAYNSVEWASTALERYHTVLPKLQVDARTQILPLYRWILVPPTLWPFSIVDVLNHCLDGLEEGKCLGDEELFLIHLLPESPTESACLAVTEHEHQVQQGHYEKLIKTPAKFAQTELLMTSDPLLHQQWQRIKSSFPVASFCDYKGVIRRSMSAERNMRSSYTLNMKCQSVVFQATFDAFCQRWNLYGMQHDTPLLLKLTVNLTPFGTMIVIPSYWSIDPKRDIDWNEIAKLHRARVPHRQGAALAEGLAERLKLSEKLAALDQQVRQLKLKGQQKHEFLCDGLGWVPATSPKRISRLRAEFKNRT
ncbi:MAG: hypothetical protein RL693_442 [Verrucomicrobiota bacterium]|jgi:hypothetical protein